MTIAVQGAIGNARSKATTELSYSFNSMAVINGVAFGANSLGLFKLNSGSQDNGVNYTSSFTLATTDFGISNPKHIRFIYIGIETDNDFTVSIRPDRGSWTNYTVAAPTTGLFRVRVPIGSNIQGRYWTIKVGSNYLFKIDSIKTVVYMRSKGIIGY